MYKTIVYANFSVNKVRTRNAAIQCFDLSSIVEVRISSKHSQGFKQFNKNVIRGTLCNSFLHIVQFFFVVLFFYACCTKLKNR